jgi:hypothetical protein
LNSLIVGKVGMVIGGSLGGAAAFGFVLALQLCIVPDDRQGGAQVPLGHGLGVQVMPLRDVAGQDRLAAGFHLLRTACPKP